MRWLIYFHSLSVLALMLAHGTSVAASFYGGEKSKGLPPVSLKELEALLSSPRSIVLSVIGLVGIGLILWLMMFKPF